MRENDCRCVAKSNQVIQLSMKWSNVLARIFLIFLNMHVIIINNDLLCNNNKTVILTKRDNRNINSNTYTLI